MTSNRVRSAARTLRASLLSALPLLAAHCEAPVPDDCEPVGVELSLLSYNLANQTGAERDRIGEIVTVKAPTFMSLQECVDCDELLDALPLEYLLTENRRAGVAIGYDASRWLAIDEGTHVLGANDDGWGERVLHWARFEEGASAAELVVASTHWCVPIRSEDDACTSERLGEYAASSLHQLQQRFGDDCTILFAGDLNLFGPAEQASVGALFEERGFLDLMAMAPIADLEATFVGNSWAPSARLDYVFGRSVPVIRGGRVDRSELTKDASDHFPLTVEL